MGICFDTGDLEIAIVPDTMEDTQGMEPYCDSVWPHVALLSHHFPVCAHSSTFENRAGSDHLRILSKYPPLRNRYYYEEGKQGCYVGVGERH